MTHNNESMITAKNMTLKITQKEEVGSSGFRIRSGIKSGSWRCSACQGKTMGSNLFQPNCEYCEKI